MTEFVTLYAWWETGTQAAVGAPAYSGATIAPVGDGSDNDIAHLLFDTNITSPTADYKTGFLLESREPGGTWTTIYTWAGSLHGDGNKIIVTSNGVVSTWHTSHEFRVSYNSSLGDIESDPGGIAMASFSNDDTVTNQSTVDFLDTMTPFWPVDENLVTDSIGTATLTNNNGVTTRGGWINHTAGDFDDASDQWLSRADEAVVSIGDIAITWGGWVLADDIAAVHNFASQFTAGGDDRGWRAYVDAAGNVHIEVSSDGTAGTISTATSTGTVSAGTWFSVLFRYDPTANTIEIKLNGDAWDSVAHSGGIFDSDSAFALGRQTDSASLDHDGGMEAWFISKRKWTDAEATDWWNGGRGKRYPFIPGGPAVETGRTPWLLWWLLS